jgi:hypothetical protein
MGGASGLPAGGGADPTQVATMPMGGGSGYAPPWAGYMAQYRQPGLLQQQQSGPAPGGGLLAGSKSPTGDNETDWINAHLDQVIRAAELSQRQKTPAITYAGTLAANASATGGAYGMPAVSYGGGPVYKDAKGNFYWDAAGKQPVPPQHPGLGGLK